MPEHNSKTEKELRIRQNNSLPSIWIDHLLLATREDGICAMSFSTNLPTGHVEQTRMMTSTQRLKEMIEQMCTTLDYYPVKEKT